MSLDLSELCIDPSIPLGDFKLRSLQDNDATILFNLKLLIIE